ncbi:MAG: PhnD/SsuA/transferrin family substrate-binding protein [Fimbriiglobus sp.]
MPKIARRAFLKTGAVAALAPAFVMSQTSEPTQTLTMIVMDPLSKELACPCVKGYAQRDYEKLAKHLEAKLGRPVKVFFGESLTNTLAKKSAGKADIIIGKESVVRHEATENKLDLAPIAALTGKDGKTTMTGLLVVATKDPAIDPNDLKGYKIIFGEASADEKHEAPIKMLKEFNISIPAKPETCVACTDGATKVLDGTKKGEKVATVISSYAQPLLEGCGTIQKGDLRVLAETEPVPFIVASVNKTLTEALRTDIQKALTDLKDHKDLCTVLETKEGFVSIAAKKK